MRVFLVNVPDEQADDLDMFIKKVIDKKGISDENFELFIRVCSINYCYFKRDNIQKMVKIPIEKDRECKFIFSKYFENNKSGAKEVVKLMEKIHIWMEIYSSTPEISYAELREIPIERPITRENHEQYKQNLKIYRYKKHYNDDEAVKLKYTINFVDSRKVFLFKPNEGNIKISSSLEHFDTPYDCFCEVLEVLPDIKYGIQLICSFMDKKIPYTEQRKDYSHEVAVALKNKEKLLNNAFSKFFSTFRNGFDEDLFIQIFKCYMDRLNSGETIPDDIQGNIILCEQVRDAQLCRIKLQSGFRLH